MSETERRLQDRVNKEVEGKILKCCYCGEVGTTYCCGKCYPTLSVEEKIFVDRKEKDWRKWLDLPDEEVCRCGNVKAWDEPVCHECHAEHLAAMAERMEER